MTERMILKLDSKGVDKPLLWTAILLALAGLVMVSSAACRLPKPSR